MLSLLSFSLYTYSNWAPVLQVVGTFIAEWGKDGKQTCIQAFASQQAAECCAAQLAGIAAHHGFEGWLVNIESELPVDLIPNVLIFLRWDT